MYLSHPVLYLSPIGPLMQCPLYISSYIHVHPLIMLHYFIFTSPLVPVLVCINSDACCSTGSEYKEEIFNQLTCGALHIWWQQLDRTLQQLQREPLRTLMTTQSGHSYKVMDDTLQQQRAASKASSTHHKHRTPRTTRSCPNVL